MRYLLLYILLLLSLGANAQACRVYEWKNGNAVVRSTNDVDSITFSIPIDAVQFTTNLPTEVSSSQMTTTVSLSVRFSVNNSELYTEQGVCFSSMTSEPTIEDIKQVYGPMYKGDWQITLLSLDSDVKYYYRPYLKVANLTFYGSVHSFITMKIPDSAVDLGLPSGTLWADRNVGANSPQEYGNYYSWGMITPLPINHWSTYQWYDGVYDYLTKYNSDALSGFVDNKSSLELCDDAATANYGQDWRIPTYEEQQELLNYCEWTWGELNSISGYYVKGPNGKSIFIPASGYRFYNELKNAGVSAVYWANSIPENNSYFAYGMTFNNSVNDILGFSRDYGCTIRAVVR